MRKTAAYTYADLPRLMTLMTGDEKHGPSATSTLDAIWVLYDRVLRVSLASAAEPDRDRFVLSKGHGPMAYYAVLAAKGFLAEDTLRSFGRGGSPLGYHPDARLIPGVEIGSGSLGHGLPIAVGLALGLRARRSGARVFCLVGDAELEEGSNWEAVQLAGRLALGGLAVVAIDNRSSTLGWPGGIAARFELEGWTTRTVNGRSHAALEEAYAGAGPAHPHLVVASVEAEQ
ncbi:MAG TPA: transketolase [Candidatus Limnocylindria bacterium]|nr:transketolase [Candidatus Limnocylindria bacterium]